MQKSQEFVEILVQTLENVAEGLMITDNRLPDHPIVYINKEICNITGYSKEELIGRNARFLQGKKTDRKTIEQLIKALKEKTPFEGELINYKKNGTTFWNRLVITPVYGADNEITHHIGLINDITKYKEIQNDLTKKNSDLKKSNTQLDSFYYSTSHELRSPLTSLMGLINIANKEQDLPHIYSLLERMKKITTIMDNTIHNIVAFSKNQGLPVKIEKINLQLLIREIFNELKDYEEIKKIKISVDLINIDFYSDYERLKIIFKNIIRNSIIFSDTRKANRFIEISSKVNNNSIVFHITDNGIGIPMDVQKKLFVMFYKGSNISKGAGLGLYLVKEVVKALNGKIHLSSNLNEGTTIEIELPLKNTS